MKRILVIDNYDSFTYNLVHCIHQITGHLPDVSRNDEIGLSDVSRYEKILLSPGPGIPEEAGICLDLIRQFASEKSILGICLGHQAIGEAFGGSLINLSQVYHGLATPVSILETGDPLFRNLPDVIRAGRYHSWVLDDSKLPACLKVTCRDETNLIMGVSHTQFDVRGLQFHPESVMTEHGYDIIRNWINL
jgi:anthranilate synthase component 2